MTWKTIDADRHVSEPTAIWGRYLPHELFDFLPTIGDSTKQEGEPEILPEIHICGQSIFKKWGTAARREAAKKSLEHGAEMQKGTNPIDQLQSMEEQGIGTAILFPTYAKFIVNNENLTPKVSVAFASAYNQWLYEYCSFHPGRLIGVGVVSRFDPRQMLIELKKIYDYGWKIVVLRPEMLMGRVLGHPDYEAFWDQCEQLGMTVAIHGGSHIQASTVGMDRFETHFALHACSHPMEIQMAFLSLLESGVFERHPNLHFAFMEAGASWIPYWLWRLDEICYQEMPGEVAEHIKMKPSEYFRRQCWISFELKEPCLREVIQTVGVDRLLFGTDFPHPDHHQFQKENFDNLGFSQDELKMVLEENPKKCFHLESSWPGPAIPQLEEVVQETTIN